MSLDWFSLILCYTYDFFSFLKSISTKTILPVTLWIGDRNAQPDDYLEQDLVWASMEPVVNYDQ